MYMWVQVVVWQVLVGIGFWQVSKFGPTPTPMGTLPMYLPGT